MTLTGLGISTAGDAVRVLLGLWFIPHAINIGLNFAPSAGFFDSVGFKPGRFFAALIMIAEGLIGICLIVNYAARPALICAAVILVCAAGAVVRLNGPKWIWLGGGVEYPLLWASLCAALAVFL